MIIDKYKNFFYKQRESKYELKKLNNCIELIGKSSRSLHKYSAEQGDVAL